MLERVFKHKSFWKPCLEISLIQLLFRFPRQPDDYAWKKNSITIPLFPNHLFHLIFFLHQESIESGSLSMDGAFFSQSKLHNILPFWWFSLPVFVWKLLQINAHFSSSSCGISCLPNSSCTTKGTEHLFWVKIFVCFLSSLNKFLWLLCKSWPG